MRRQVLEDFEACFEALDARTKASLARSWKIFGRVIARKSLVDLNSNLDDIRRSIARLSTADFYDQEVLSGVTLSEIAAASNLQDNDLVLTRSQGEAWVSQMRADLARLTVLQNSLISLDAQRRGAGTGFAKESQHLAALAQSLKAPPEPASNAASLVSRAVNAPRVPPSVSPPIGPAVPAAAAADPSNEPVSETSSTYEYRQEALGPIFWVSAMVLLLLLWVSIRTVMSVVGPVRRIRAATLKIAGGRNRRPRHARRHPGTGRSGCFLQSHGRTIADAKATARNYQEQLEAKVKLRTRELRHLAEHDPLTATAESAPAIYASEGRQSRAREASAATSACSSSIWTISRTSTTAWVMPSATACSARSPSELAWRTPVRRLRGAARRR